MAEVVLTTKEILVFEEELKETVDWAEFHFFRSSTSNQNRPTRIIRNKILETIATRREPSAIHTEMTMMKNTFKLSYFGVVRCCCMNASRYGDNVKGRCQTRNEVEQLCRATLLINKA